MTVEAFAAGVTVRIVTPDSADPRDLAERVATLLARHGYPATRVSVNGAPTASGQGHQP